jgi:hypothetical protein
MIDMVAVAQEVMAHNAALEARVAALERRLDGVRRAAAAESTDTQSGPRQMQLNAFCDRYDIPRSTAMDLIHRDNFPAHKIGARWYVDIPAYFRWREETHRQNYRFAK